MLNELYQYAVTHGLTARVGYKERKVKAYLNFVEGSPLPLLSPAVQTATYAPDLGSKANGTRVVFPAPGGAIKTTQPASLRRATNSGNMASIGRIMRPYRRFNRPLP